MELNLFRCYNCRIKVHLLPGGLTDNFMRLRYLHILAIFLLAASVPGQASWAGTYTFDEDGGKTAGGTSILVTHVLEIIETDDGFAAVLKSNGYQTSRDLNCNTRNDGAKLFIFFESYGDDNVFEPYSAGDLLLTLERKSAKNGETVLTTWGAFKPVSKKNEKPGKVYFVKSEALLIDH